MKIDVFKPHIFPQVKFSVCSQNNRLYNRFLIIIKITFPITNSFILVFVFLCSLQLFCLRCFSMLFWSVFQLVSFRSLRSFLCNSVYLQIIRFLKYGSISFVQLSLSCCCWIMCYVYVCVLCFLLLMFYVATQGGNVVCVQCASLMSYVTSKCVNLIKTLLEYGQCSQ